MARARNIKPSFFQNDTLADLPALARLLFIGLWTICDFKGCMEFRPKRIKAQILPYDDCDVEALANNLDKSGFIAIYSVQGQPYLKIVNFERHQNPHKNERDAGSDCPDILEKDNAINELTQDGSNPDKNGTARADSLFPQPSSLNPHPTHRNPDSVSAVAGMPMREIPPVSLDPAVILSVALRRQGVVANSAHPAVQDWANRGVTLDMLTEAVLIARSTKGDATIPPNYLVPIVESLLNPPAARTPSQSRAAPVNEKFNFGHLDRSGDKLAMAESMKRHNITVPDDGEEIEI